MNRTFKAAVAALILAVGFAGSVAAGPFEDAEAAYKKSDYATALRLIRPLADQGNATAQHNLGVMYEKGQGVPQDYTAAASWYRKAAKQGDADAQVMLGNMYADGRGVPQDDAAAIAWYRRSADQGDAIAQHNLALMYANNGQGVPQDNVIGYMWFDLASARGVENAANNRDIIARRVTPARIAEAQKLAREWKPTPAPH